MRTWRCYLEGLEITMVTNHNPFGYLQTQSNLSGRQVRWSEYLQAFRFNIDQIPGRRWEMISADLIAQLPRTKSGNTQIVVFVDTLIKGQAHQSTMQLIKQIINARTEPIHRFVRGCSTSPSRNSLCYVPLNRQPFRFSEGLSQGDALATFSEHHRLLIKIKVLVLSFYEHPEDASDQICCLPE
ncbi:hypothetical protein WJX82_006641 [Trebouxia sp. C0006]